MSASRNGQYALGGAASGLASTVPSTLLLYFSTTVLSLHAGLVALILLAPKLLAVVGDPLCGRLFDRLADRPRRRAMLLGGGVVVLIIGFLLVFAPPALDGTGPTAIWLAVAYLTFCAGYSLFSVAHIAGPATLASTGKERDRLVSWRMTAVLVGILIGAAIAPFIVAANGGGRHGYAVMALVVAVVVAVLTIGSIRVYGTAQAVAAGALPANQSLWAALGIVRFRRLAIGYAVMMAAVGAITAATPYWVVQRNGGSESEVGVLLGISLSASIVTAPMWSALCKTRGERVALNVVLWAYVALGMALAAMLALSAQNTALMLLFGALGIAFGGLQIVPFTMLAQIGAEASAQRGVPMEGGVSGAWTATEKIGLAAGPAATAMLLSLSDDRPGLSFSLGVASLLVLGAGGALLATIAPRVHGVPAVSA